MFIAVYVLSMCNRASVTEDMKFNVYEWRHELYLSVNERLKILFCFVWQCVTTKVIMTWIAGRFKKKIREPISNLRFFIYSVSSHHNKAYQWLKI